MADPVTLDLLVMEPTLTLPVIVHTKTAEFDADEPSVAVRVTVQAQAVVGVPVIAPVEALMPRPFGRPDWLHVKVAPDWESVALGVKVTMAEPEALDLLPGLVTVTVLVTFQVKAEVEAEKLALSVSVTTTEHVHGVVGVPETVPVELLMESPAGRPVADQVLVAVDEESDPEMDRGVMAEPVELDWVPGLVAVTVLVTFQVKLAEPEKPELSVAVTVTEQAHAVIGVPVMAPVVRLIESPTGRPDADQLATVAVDEVSEAETVSVAMAVPEVEFWVAGAVTVTVLEMVQVKLAAPA